MAREFLPLCDVLFNIISLALYFCDVVFDVITAYTLYEQGQELLAVLALALVSCSLLASQAFSLWHYVQKSNVGGTAGNVGACERASVCFVHAVQCGVLWRYFKLFVPVHFCHVKCEVRDLCVLRVMHAFGEAAPMLLLQLYVVFQKQSPSDITDLNLVSTVLSLFNVCWALASFSKYVRRHNVHRLVLTWLGVLSQFLWRLGTVTSRAAALTVYAVVYGHWLFLVLGLHWISMFLWLISPRNVFRHGEDGGLSRTRWIASSALVAFIYVFCYVNVQEVNSRQKIVAYYVTMLLENSLLIAVWLVGIRSDVNVWYRDLVLVAVFASFGVGLFFMVLYYRYFHVKRLKYTYAQAGDTSGFRLSHGEGQVAGMPKTVPAAPCRVEEPKVPARKTNGHCRHSHVNREPPLLPPYVPGVFSCRFNPAMKRKKKKPTSFVPPPIPVLPSMDVYGRMSEPFWKKPLPSASAQSENESSVGSRVDIRQKLREKKQQQLAKLRMIEEEIRQGKLKRPNPSDMSDSGTLRQPIPRAKKQPWLHSDSLHVPYVMPPLHKQRSKTPEILLSPQYLENTLAYYESLRELEWKLGVPYDRDVYEYCSGSNYLGLCQREERSGKSTHPDKNMYKSYRIPSDLDSQISLPRSYTLPREFRYHRKSRPRKTVRSDHFVPSTNSSDGDVDSAEDNEAEQDVPYKDKHNELVFCHSYLGRGANLMGGGLAGRNKLHETKL